MKFNKSEILESKAAVFFKKYWLYITVVAAVIIVAVSSVKLYREEVLDIDPNVQYETQNTLYFASAGIDTLNPIVSKSEDTYYISKLIYNSLFDYDENLGAVCELAESYSVDTEKAYIDIKLKDGIKWQDGTQLTAKDVSFTVDAIQSYGSGGIYYKQASKIYSVNVKDSLNLRIYFRNNYNCSLDDLTFPILPSSKYSYSGKLISDTDGFIPMGTGQYKYSSYQPSKELSLVPNEGYYSTKASNNIIFTILPSKDYASNMMEIQTVSCYADKSSQRKSLVADKELTMYNVVSNDVDFMVFNTSKKIFKNSAMRQAVCYAMDYNEILKSGYMEDGVLSDTLYYPGFLGAAEDSRYYEGDREKARELLKDEGYQDKDLNGRLEDEEGNDIDQIVILVNSNNANRIAAAKILENDLEEVGFSVVTHSVSWDEYNSRIKAKDFDILLTGYEIEASYDLREFFNGKNPWGYMNTEILSKVQELDRIHIAEEYKEAFKEIKELMLEDATYSVLCYKYMGMVCVNSFEMPQLPMFNDIYKNCYTWSWKKEIKTEKAEDSDKSE